MKVDNPKFDSCQIGSVRCVECPFANEFGRMVSDEMADTCEMFGTPSDPCPTIETYAEACKLAEGATNV